MSRTEGVHLPRLPPGHAKAASPRAIQPHSRSGKSMQHGKYGSVLSEPHYTAYLGTPRQDLPDHVYRDAAMFDDVFDKQGRLLSNRNTPKITSPLTSIGYNSLHDPHCRRLFLNNRALREHLVHLGMLTDDLRVVATTKEQRQKIRAHELLERKEQLVQKLDKRERSRLDGLQRHSSLPSQYLSSIQKIEQQQQRYEQIKQMKEEKILKSEEEKRQKEEERKRRRKQDLMELIEQVKLLQQTQRNEARAKQEMAEMMAYEKQYGRTAIWHREADIIHNKMVVLQQTKWAKGKQIKWLSESYPGRRATTASTDSSVDIEATYSPCPPDESYAIPAPSRPTEDEQPPVNETVLPQIVPEPSHKKEESENKLQETKEGDEKMEEHQLKEDTSPLPNHEAEETREKEETDAVDLIKAEPVPTQDPEKKAIEEEPIPDVASKQEAPLDTTQSALELTQLFTDILVQADPGRTGYITIDDFIQIIQSRELGLPLDQQELLYLASQADIQSTGWVPIVQAASLLPGLLTVIFQQRMSLELQHYGQYTEEQWCILQSPYKVVYMEKATGLVQYERPPDFRPQLKDNLFEDVIVELFTTADMNNDGYIDQAEFYSLLQSPMVSTRLYSDQMEEMYQLFLSQEEALSLEQFIPLAHVIIQMIYKNSYPTQEWVELQSYKCGQFFFNTNTGETRCKDASKSHKTPSRKKKRKKHSDTAPESTGSAAPPPLRKRMSRSREGDQNDAVQENEPKLEKKEEISEESDKETQALVEQVAERLQSGLHLIDTIPEEEEEEDKVLKSKEQLSKASDEPELQSDEQPTEATISNSDGAILDEVLEKVLADRQ